MSSAGGTSGYGQGKLVIGYDAWNLSQFTLTDTGFVGIGTIVPGTALDVVGAITSQPYGAASGQTGQIIMRELAAGGADTATIRAPDALAASYVLTLPADDGTIGQVLATDGNGVLSWASSIAPAADSLDFTHFADTMTLDASTDIAASGTNVLSITNSGTGASFRVNDDAGDTTPFLIDASGNVGPRMPFASAICVAGGPIGAIRFVCVPPTAPMA